MREIQIQFSRNNKASISLFPKWIDKTIYLKLHIPIAPNLEKKIIIKLFADL